MDTNTVPSRPARPLTGPQQAWVDALRSGKYKQATKALTLLDANGQPSAHCCLGVACELALASGVKVRLSSHVVDDVPRRTYDNGAAVLPAVVRRWLGMTNDSGRINGDLQLTAENDNGMTFPEIADLIEKHADVLFVDEVSA